MYAADVTQHKKSHFNIACTGHSVKINL